MLRMIAFLAAALAFAQAPTASMKQLMLDLIYPSSNQILLTINRNGPADETEWAAMRRSALTLAESANLLLAPGRARDGNDWQKDARLLADAGATAYRAALAKDAKGLATAAAAIDRSCTICHKQYRPDVFPRQRGSQ